MHNMKQVLAAVLAVFGLWLGASVGRGAEEQEQGLERSVVMLRSVRQDFDYVMPWKRQAMTQALGSGFVIEGKRILTNAHNVSNNRYLELRKEHVAKRYPAKVAFIGHDCDLALITVFDESFFEDMRPLELGGIPKVNSRVSTYGFPVGGMRISVTEGVISRIEMDVYAHSGADSHLVVQTDAAINPGNSGGPVMQEGKVVGVAFQGLRQAENIGYLIPTTVIRHFLADVEDGKYDAFGTLGVILYPGLHSASYKEYLKVPEDEDGVVVVATMMHSSVETVLREGDVITRIDDYNVDNDGMVRIHGSQATPGEGGQERPLLRLHLSEVVEGKQIGETATVTFYRGGQLMKETVTVGLNRPVFEYATQYDHPPRYVCFAGLTFVPATRNYLETWGREWLTDLPYYLRYLFNHSMQLNTDRERKEYVVVAGMLPDEVNAYADGFKSQVVESVNGKAIWSLDDVYEALKEPVDGFHVLKFMGSNRTLIVDGGLAGRRQPVILEKYQVPAEALLESQL